MSGPTVATTRPSTARRQALREAFPEWTPTTLHGRLDSCARLYGSRPLVICDDATLTYRDVAFESQRLAAGLRELGIERGDRVGLVMANHPEFVTLKFAISRAGAIAVPFNFLYKQDELAYVLGRFRVPCPGDDDGVRRPGLSGHARRVRARLGHAGFAAPPGRAQRRGARAATRGGPGHRRARAPRCSVGRRPGGTGSRASGPRPRSGSITGRSGRHALHQRAPPVPPRVWSPPTTRCCGPRTPRR